MEVGRDSRRGRLEVGRQGRHVYPRPHDLVSLLHVPVLYSNFVLELKLIRWEAVAPVTPKQRLHPPSSRNCRAQLFA